MSNGLRFLAFLACTYFLQKGGALTLLELALLPLFQRDLQVSSVTYQRLKTIVYSPFSLKPILAVASDSRPICGFKKRMYIVIASVIGGSAILFLALEMHSLTPRTVAALAFACVLSASLTDILTEGKYSEIIRLDKTGVSSKLVGFVWVCIFLGRLVASIVAGPVSDHGGTWKLLIACAILTYQIVLPALAGWMPEKRSYEKQDVPEELVYLGGIIVMSTAMVIFASLSGRLWLQCVVGLFCAGAIVVASRALLRPDNRTAHYTNLFLFVTSVLQADASPLEYWYTSTSCDGPQMSYTWYITTCGVVSSIASAVGAAAVSKFAKNWSYRTLFVLSAAFKCLGGFVDLAITAGWVDPSRVRAVFVLGDCTAKPLVAMLAHIPAVVLTSKLVSPGNEATMYSLLAGMQNLGGLLAIVLGQVLASTLHVEVTDTTCADERLPTFVVLAQIGLPLLSLCLITYVPMGTMKSGILEET